MHLPGPQLRLVSLDDERVKRERFKTLLPLYSLKAAAGYFGSGEAVEPEGWLEAGLQAGYFDQPQMARDFRRFLGCTATDWARDQHALARAIASQARVAS